MKIAIFGVSSNTSIGYYVGQYFHENLGAGIVYVSRSGKIGVKCDINDSEQVDSFLSKENPEVIIHAAGIFSEPQRIGNIKKLDNVREHILAKSFGALILADVASRCSGVKHIIIFGGRETSSDPGFAVYSVANGALWALVSFFSTHIHTKNIYYIDLPLIKNTTMEKLYVKSGGDSTEQGTSNLPTEVKAVIDVVKKITDGKYASGSRIIINKKSKL